MHENRVVHRDLNPKNIFLTKSGDLKIGDLGLTCRLNELTISNSMMGIILLNTY